MFRRKVTLFSIGLLVFASTMVLGPIPTSAGIARLYSVRTVVTKGVEVTNHTLSHASDDAWYQIDSIKEGANYKIDVKMFYSITVDPIELNKIYVFSEAHTATVSNPVAINIYNHKTGLWELCFNVDAAVDTSCNRTITENLTDYIGSKHEIKLQVYYKDTSIAQSIYQDHTYIELVPKGVSPVSPVADFVWTPERPQVGETVVFDASASSDPDGIIVDYAWNFSDGTPIEHTPNETIGHIYTALGTYNVTLTVTDNDNLTASIMKTVKVYSPPVIVSLSYTPEFPLANETVNFITDAYDPDGYIINYTWYFGDDTPPATTVDPFVTHVYAAAGNYTVTLTVTDNDGETDTESKPITVGGYPVARFTYSPADPLSGQTVTFNASASYDPDGYIVWYHWNFGDTTPQVNTTDQIVNHTFTVAGTYNVTLTVCDNDAKIDTTFEIITIRTLPVVDFVWTPELPLVDETVIFNASLSTPDGGTIVWYYWDFGDDTNLNTTNPIAYHAYATFGNFSVTLTIKDSEGLTDSVTKYVKIYASPVADFTILPAPPHIAPILITFNGSLSYDPDGYFTLYEWTIENVTDPLNPVIIAILTGHIADYNFTLYGNYTVTLTVTDNDGFTDIKSKTIAVIAYPIARFTYSSIRGPEPTPPLAGDVVTFNASDSTAEGGTIMWYYWDFGDGKVANTTYHIIDHVYTACANYTVTLTIMDSEGLTDSETKYAVVYVRDVAVVSVDTVYPWGANETTGVYPGWKVNITVSVRNEGNLSETFWVAVYYNITATKWEIIGNQTITLDPGAQTTRTFVWDTAGVPPSIIDHTYTVYTIKAEASVVPGEKVQDQADNMLIDGAVWLKVLGDADADGHVTVADLTILALSWYKTPIDPRADFNGDGKVIVTDLTILALNWYKI